MKRFRRIGCVSLAVLAVLAIFLLTYDRTPRLSDSIAFLKGVPVKRSRELYTVNAVSHTGGGSSKFSPVEIVSTEDTFTFTGNFEPVERRAKAELGPRAVQTHSFSGVTSYNLPDPGEPGREFSVLVSKADHTVVIQQYRDPTWFDRARNWVDGLFNPKPKPRSNVFIVR